MEDDVSSLDVLCNETKKPEQGRRSGLGGKRQMEELVSHGGGMVLNVTRGRAKTTEKANTKNMMSSVAEGSHECTGRTCCSL